MNSRSHKNTLAMSLFAVVALWAVSGCSSDDDNLFSSGNEGGTDQGQATGSNGGRAGNDVLPSESAGRGSDGSISTGGKGADGSTTGGSSTQAGGSGTKTGGSGPTGSGGAEGGSSNVVSSGGTGLTPEVIEKLDCGSDGCQCNNGVDDDGDGQIDGFDVECISPYDNDEGTFATGIPGDNSDPKWQDCFFDGNSGAGDDKCRYSTRCLTGELDLSDEDCTVTQACIDFCAPKAPNGCDCFGCCGITDQKGEERFVYVAGECTEESLDDPDACIECTQSTQCTNECGECELCPGMEPEDLPETCAAPPPDGAGGAGGAEGAAGAGAEPEVPVYTCDNGMPVCALDIPCGTGAFCMNGCCMWVGL